MDEIARLRAQVAKLELEVKHWKVEWKIDRDAWSAADRDHQQAMALLDWLLKEPNDAAQEAARKHLDKHGYEP